MKIQSLAIIFIIIILPISLVLSSYTKAKVETIDMQTQYDAKLNDATHDALKAYQVNNFFNDNSGLTNSKMRDIEGSVNTFFNSLSSNFSSLGFTKTTLQNYVPALVYTMYDGYYIYSPYINTWGTNSTNDEIRDEMQSQIGIQESGTYNNGDILFGLKPYVSYSCRYIMGDIDVVITYSLDNYIQIQGKIGDKAVSKYGYLLNDRDLVINGVSSESYNGNIDIHNEQEVKNTQVKYKGEEITNENNLKEFVCVNNIYYELPYKKKNGVKYYIDQNSSVLGKKNDYVFSLSSDGTPLPQCIISAEEIIGNSDGSENVRNSSSPLPYVQKNRTRYYVDINAEVLGMEKDYIFSINLDTNIMKQESTITAEEIKNNNNAKKYYIEAANLRKFIKDKLSNLSTKHIVDMETGIKYENEPNVTSPYYPVGSIFDNYRNIEAEDSNFNTHRIDVIKNSINRNLSIAISNFNNYSRADEFMNFQMPELKDTDWDKIMDNISVISFFQGANIGGKIYNGYSIITNTKNEDVVMEDSIYIRKEDGYISHIAEDGLQNDQLNNAIGIFNINTEIRADSILNSNNAQHYIPVTGLLSYESIITKNGISDDYNNDVGEYVDNLGTSMKKLKNLYYTALARERYSLYRPKLEI